MMYGAVLNCVSSGVISEFENVFLGADNNIASDMLSGLAVGALLGPGATGTRLVEDAAAQAFGEKLGGYVSAGVVSALSTFLQAGAKAQWVDEEQMKRIAKDPTAQAGIAIGLGVAAKFIGGHVPGVDPDSIILDTVLDMGREMGVGSIENIWGEAEQAAQ